ncbi:uncharacterized protein LOC117147744 isoform X1 [Drosophila mauritiana]|uniref:Uncharacterized protein LOC117147744 isoform X1 n=1 Tax=Drosophila mauritiana TaxID=7226 RepID=A0A6P8L5N1_DROMA|nr:uncharacterized protein LOC117147744 isoform X1 [Drosophila mauritiana]
MSSIDWVGDMLYYVMRTFLGLIAPVHFLIDVLGKIEHFIYFIEFSMMIMRRPRNFQALTGSQANRLQLYNCLLMLRTWAKYIYILIYALVSVVIKGHLQYELNNFLPFKACFNPYQDALQKYRDSDFRHRLGHRYDLLGNKWRTWQKNAATRADSLDFVELLHLGAGDSERTDHLFV